MTSFPANTYATEKRPLPVSGLLLAYHEHWPPWHGNEQEESIARSGWRVAKEVFPFPAGEFLPVRDSMSSILEIQDCRNILLVQLGDIGDVVLATPAIRAVKESHPAARLSILVFKPYGSLLAADPHLHEIVETSRVSGSFTRRIQEYSIFVRELRQRHYDLVIDLRTGDRGALLSFLSGAKMRIGCQGTRKQFWHDFLFTRVLRELKAAPLPVHPGADQSLRVVRELGITTEDSTPHLYIAPADRQRATALLAEAGLAPATGMVTVNPFSRWKYKEWSNEKWGEVLDRLWEARRVPTVLVGSPEEATGCEEIVAGREGRTISLAGKSSLGELAAILSMSSLHLGVDSAAPHIAAAVGTPTVTLHGPSDWRAWRVISEQHRVISPVMDCLPCNKKGCDGNGKSHCMDELGVESVVRMAQEILELLGQRGNALS